MITQWLQSIGVIIWVIRSRFYSFMCSVETLTVLGGVIGAWSSDLAPFDLHVVYGCTEDVQFWFKLHFTCKVLNCKVYQEPEQG